MTQDPFIHVWAYNTKIFNYAETVANIIDAAHKHDTVNLTFKQEGVAIEKLTYLDKPLIEILKAICHANDWPLSKFVFHTGNLIQDRSVWPTIEFLSGIDMPLESNCWLYGQKVNHLPQKNIKYHFGCFVNGSNWSRLYLSAYLYHKHHDKTLQTFRRDVNDPAHMVNLDLDQMMMNFSQHGKITEDTMQMLSSFIPNIPIERSKDKNILQQQHVRWNKGAYGSELLGWYDMIFVDVVCETYFSGQTFSPTEKTFRTFMAKTPFIAMGPAGHLTNLKKLGFKTFSSLWDESYDHLEGVQRIDAIEQLLEHIGSKDVETLKKMRESVSDVLEHNHKTYYELTAEHIFNTFGIQ